MSDSRWEKRDHVDQDTLLRVLGETSDVLDRTGIPYVFIGGLPLSVYGRPKPIKDLDVMVRHEDVEKTMQVLADAGFETKDAPEEWLHKAAKDGVLVDVITRSEGDLYLDDELLGRALERDYKGRNVKLVGPEDLLVMKAIAHEEDTPHYWHDAMALIVGVELDWDYIVQRARHGAKRLLSLLIYAQSTDLFVPDETIDELYRSVYR
ncbi:MAG TPA: nucleotidyltransferase [Actinomycetota bacterium]|nr:nucleotidyltransferase [Actinomycetota bacterium]